MPQDAIVLVKGWHLERGDEPEAFNQFLVAVAYGDFGYLGDFGDFPLGFSFAGEDGGDIAGSGGYARGSSS